MVSKQFYAGEFSPWATSLLHLKVYLACYVVLTTWCQPLLSLKLGAQAEASNEAGAVTRKLLFIIWESHFLLLNSSGLVLDVAGARWGRCAWERPVHYRVFQNTLPSPSRQGLCLRNSLYVLSSFPHPTAQRLDFRVLTFIRWTLHVHTRRRKHSGKRRRKLQNECIVFPVPKQIYYFSRLTHVPWKYVWKEKRITLKML